MIAGDSRLERKINVAPEFPKNLFGKDELATTMDVINILGLTEGQQIEAHVSFTKYYNLFVYSMIYSSYCPLTSLSLSA
jgi:hypothetical protein